MNKCTKIYASCCFIAAILSLIIGTIASLGLRIEPDAVLASVSTTFSFGIMMSIAVNKAYKLGKTENHTT